MFLFLPIATQRAYDVMVREHSNYKGPKVVQKSPSDLVVKVCRVTAHALYFLIPGIFGSLVGKIMEGLKSQLVSTPERQPENKTIEAPRKRLKDFQWTLRDPTMCGRRPLSRTKVTQSSTPYQKVKVPQFKSNINDRSIFEDVALPKIPKVIPGQQRLAEKPIESAISKASKQDRNEKKNVSCKKFWEDHRSLYEDFFNNNAETSATYDLTSREANSSLDINKLISSHENFDEVMRELELKEMQRRLERLKRDDDSALDELPLNLPNQTLPDLDVPVDRINDEAAKLVEARLQSNDQCPSQISSKKTNLQIDFDAYVKQASEMEVKPLVNSINWDDELLKLSFNPDDLPEVDDSEWGAGAVSHDGKTRSNKLGGYYFHLLQEQVTYDANEGTENQQVKTKKKQSLSKRILNGVSKFFSRGKNKP